MGTGHVFQLPPQYRYTDSMKLLRILTGLCLSLWIFYIPTSIAYHYHKELGVINGFVVDYQIPQISVSAIFLSASVALLLIQLLLSHWKVRKKPSASQLWHEGLQILRNYRSVAIVALLCSFLFQYALCSFQFLAQRSLMGYLPFGEVLLQQTTTVKGTLPNGTLVTLPYGTSPHPNVIAGWMVIAWIAIVMLTNKKKYRVYYIVMFGMALCVVVLTQSVSAALALLAALLLLLFAKSDEQIMVPIIKMGTVVFPIFTAIALALPSARHSIFPSILRRAVLEQIALKMFAAHPFFGVGWNQFTVQLELYGFVPAPMRFIQPVHHIFLLLLSELGIIGIVIWIMWTWILTKVGSRYLLFLAPLTIIGSLDHYLFSLNPGRMMIVFIAVIYALTSSQQKTNAV